MKSESLEFYHSYSAMCVIFTFLAGMALVIGRGDMGRDIALGSIMLAISIVAGVSGIIHYIKSHKQTAQE